MMGSSVLGPAGIVLALASPASGAGGEMIVRINDMPDRHVHLRAPPGATIHRWPPEYGAVRWPGAAVYVRKEYRRPRPAGCAMRGFADEIDLAPYRRNGFRLRAARFAPVAPQGALVTPDARSQDLVLTYADAHGRWRADPRDAVRIRVDAGAWQVAMDDAEVSCVIAYRLYLSVIGPRGIHPLTGLPFGARPR